MPVVTNRKVTISCNDYSMLMLCYVSTRDRLKRDYGEDVVVIDGITSSKPSASGLWFAEIHLYIDPNGPVVLKKKET
jgi:hypothetical protein